MKTPARWGLLIALLCLLVAVAALPAARDVASAPWRATRTARPATATVVGTPAATPGAGTPAARVETRTFGSAALGREMRYIISLPATYDADESARFPVLYMLHGIGGSIDEWQVYGIFGVANEFFAAGQLAPFIIVLPQGDKGYWMNHANGGPRWGDYVARDLVAEIDGRFRTVAAREARAVGGLSMGGHGAIQLAMNYPDTFGIAGAHSPTLRSQETAPKFFGDAAHFAAHDPPSLVRARPEVAKRLILWIDVGLQDKEWRASTEAFHRQLEEAGIPHEWHQWPGEHWGTYWQPHVPDYLGFYGKAFARGGAGENRPCACDPRLAVATR